MKIKLIDGFEVPDPENLAMLQALYSRSHLSVDEHLKSATRPGASDKFMDRYVVKYGHRSIAQCATVTLFIEGVSFLAAKAIQDTPLYNGQESSTRYIDWAHQEFVSPRYFIEEVKDLYGEYRLIQESRGRVIDYLKEQFNSPEGVTKDEWDKAVEAYSFDILRGFLPASGSTQLSWSTTLDHAHDRLSFLIQHPLIEVRLVGEAIHDQLFSKYPSSFRSLDYYREPMSLMLNQWYYEGNGIPKSYFFESDLTPEVSLQLSSGMSALAKSAEAYALSMLRMENLSPGTNAALPHVRLIGSIDFGSFRDLQRHRPGNNPMPYLGQSYLGLETWYFDSLPGRVKHQAFSLCQRALNLSHRIGTIDKFEAQYVVPLCQKVIYNIAWSIPQLLYVCKLRSQQTVHHTLREEVLRWVNRGEALLGITMPGIDRSKSTISVRRGGQTINAQ